MGLDILDGERQATCTGDETCRIVTASFQVLRIVGSRYVNTEYVLGNSIRSEVDLANTNACFIVGSRVRVQSFHLATRRRIARLRRHHLSHLYHPASASLVKAKLKIFVSAFAHG